MNGLTGGRLPPGCVFPLGGLALPGLLLFIAGWPFGDGCTAFAGWLLPSLDRMNGLTGGRLPPGCVFPLGGLALPGLLLFIAGWPFGDGCTAFAGWLLPSLDRMNGLTGRLPPGCVFPLGGLALPGLLLFIAGWPFGDGCTAFAGWLLPPG
jgi:hypothetical protein